ncbi:unnamed protein product [Pleuronectes platessa]|uniref:Uncharacterized protein n=1 Tax=Pleuronectes platessa TaxID=8262 RepID=A0A9N7YJK8_PLEPL|nr:unnamed protein product [Pleuronectes platessa]
MGLWADEEEDENESLARGDLLHVPGSEGVTLVVKHDCRIDCTEPPQQLGYPSQDLCIIRPDGYTNLFGGVAGKGRPGEVELTAHHSSKANIIIAIGRKWMWGDK